MKIEKLKNAYPESHGEDSESLLSCARLAEVNEVDDWARIVLDKIASPAALRSVEENQKAVESGWRENLELARKGKISADVLRPRYFRPSPYLRLNKGLVVSNYPELEYVLFDVVRKILFGKYLQGCDELVEFGCGSCGDLLLFSAMYSRNTVAWLRLG